MKRTDAPVNAESVSGAMPAASPMQLWQEAALKRRTLGDYWDIMLIMCLAIALWLPRLTGSIDLRTDAAAYYVLGTSLAEGHGYRAVNEPGSPEAVQYPPLLPVFVALHQWAIGTDKIAVVGPWLRISYAALFLAYAAAVIALSRRFLRPGLAVVASVLALLQVMTIFLSDLLFAEIPFALISVLFLIRTTAPQPSLRPWVREAILFVLATAGFLLRTTGIALLAAWVLEGLISRHYRLTLMRAVLALVPIFAWQSYVAGVTSSNEYRHPAYAYQRAPYEHCNVPYINTLFYKDSLRPDLGRIGLGGFVARFGKNALAIVPSVGEMVTTNKTYWERLIAKTQKQFVRRLVIPQKGLELPLLIGLAVFVGIGFGVVVCRGAWSIVFLTLISVVLICVTPWPEQFTRYLMPLTPMLTICAVLGGLAIYARLRQVTSERTTLAVKSALLAMLLMSFGAQTFAAKQIFQRRRSEAGVMIDLAGRRSKTRLFHHDRSWQKWEEAVAWIARHARRDAVIATSSPQLCYLRSGQLSVLPPREPEPVRARRLLEGVPVEYVIIDELRFVDISQRYTLPAVRSDPVRWRLVQSIDGTLIFAQSGFSRVTSRSENGSMGQSEQSNRVTEL